MHTAWTPPQSTETRRACAKLEIHVTRWSFFRLRNNRLRSTEALSRPLSHITHTHSHKPHTHTHKPRTHTNHAHTQTTHTHTRTTHTQHTQTTHAHACTHAHTRTHTHTHTPRWLPLSTARGSSGAAPREPPSTSTSSLARSGRAPPFPCCSTLKMHTVSTQSKYSTPTINLGGRTTEPQC